MRKHLFVFVAVSCMPIVAVAQKPPAVRALGPIERVSTEPLASVSTAVRLPDGRVYANDIAARRVLLFDSTLSHGTVVADSTSATANAYGARPGVLIGYRADTAVFMDPGSASLLVLGPTGKIDRIIAAPQPGGTPFTPNLGSTPGFDARGRLVYSRLAVPMNPTPNPKPGKTVNIMGDSAFLVRFDFAASRLDTIGVIRAPRGKSAVVRDEDGRMTSLTITPDLFPVVDDWALSADGTLAIVRGRDYHVDWLGADAKWRSTPKASFEWEHFDDARKTALIDSSLAAIKAQRDSTMAALAARGNPLPPSDGGGGGRGARGGGGGGGPTGPAPTLIDGRPELADLPDYRPAFLQRSVRADAAGNLWVRTTALVGGQPIYDVIDRNGQLIDRVQLPAFRTIAGFGPGVVYMAVKDSGGVVHLERARIK